MSGRYLNFDLLVKRDQPGYRATVLASPVGRDASTIFAPPFTDLELENLRLRVTSNRATVRSPAAASSETARVFGERLFSAVFSGEVERCFQTSLDKAAGEGAGLRVRLDGATDLDDVPWEYLYSPHLERFLSLSSETPVVRHIATPYVVPHLATTLPLRLLVMVADPADFSRLDGEREWGNLRRAVADLEQRGLLSVDRVQGGTFAALQAQLRQGAYHILHFVGHGSFDERAGEGALVFEDAQGRGRAMSGREVGALLHDYTSLRLIVLNACEGGRASSGDPSAGVAQALVRQRIPAVVAMQYEISDGAAVTFSKEFYRALAAGMPLDASIAESRKAMYGDGCWLEWGTPVLYTLEDDSEVFDIEWPAGGVSTLQPAHAAPALAEPAAVAPVAAAAVVEAVVTAITFAPRAAQSTDCQSVATSRLAAAMIPSLVLATTFAINWAETRLAVQWTPAVSNQALNAASTMRWLERHIEFQFLDLSLLSMAAWTAIVGYSFAYFFLFPALGFAVAIALARRAQAEPYRVFAVAIAIDYALSLIGFLAYPVPERWSFPESGAMLLSDLWSSTLIETIRPISALNNCFPSFHVSMTVITIVACYVYDVRMRTAVAALGGIVIVSTFVLGIHWLPDMIAGAAIGTISVMAARRLCQWWSRRKFPLTLTQGQA